MFFEENIHRILKVLRKIIIIKGNGSQTVKKGGGIMTRTVLITLMFGML